MSEHIEMRIITGTNAGECMCCNGDMRNVTYEIHFGPPGTNGRFAARICRFCLAEIEIEKTRLDIALWPKRAAKP